jgi:hypothetical protein
MVFKLPRERLCDSLEFPDVEAGIGGAFRTLSKNTSTKLIRRIKSQRPGYVFISF